MNKHEKLKQIVKRNAARQTITTEEGLKAASAVIQVAEESGIDYALAGGISLHLYGFLRATTDVDIISEKALPIKKTKNLSFGGESYPVKVGNKIIDVDWIVRNDEEEIFYQAALEDAAEFEGIKVITPEWLVIIKHLAGRAKDKNDLNWLLQQDDLVDRELVKQHIKTVLGRNARYLIDDLQSDFDYNDVVNMRGQRSKYE